MRQEIVFGTEIIGYEIRFLPTRRTLGIEVHPDLSQYCSVSRSG